MYRRVGEGGLGVGKEEKGKHETSPSVRQPISQATKNVSVLEKKKPLPLLVDETQARLEIGLVSLSLLALPRRNYLFFLARVVSSSLSVAFDFCF